MPRALKVCSVPGCPELTHTGRCPHHRKQADRARGSARERGYDRKHEVLFRKAVLARDPICKLCGKAWSKHADHYPLGRDELVRRGLDPSDPKHGRGLCARCHSIETAKHQPGGWHAR